jgi:hypothetical protein
MLLAPTEVPNCIKFNAGSTKTKVRSWCGKEQVPDEQVMSLLCLSVLSACTDFAVTVLGVHFKYYLNADIYNDIFRFGTQSQSVIQR